MCDFSYSLKLPPYEKSWHPEFFHQGRNAYAYLLAKYGTASGLDGEAVDTFDFVSLQLYETNSSAEYYTTVLQLCETNCDAECFTTVGVCQAASSVKQYLTEVAAEYDRGFRIRIPPSSAGDVASGSSAKKEAETIPEVEGEVFTVRVPRDKLVWGFSFGRAAAGNFFVRDFDKNLPENRSTFRGAMFWNMEIDGTGIETDDKSDPSKFLHMARELSEALFPGSGSAATGTDPRACRESHCRVL